MMFPDRGHAMSAPFQEPSIGVMVVSCDHYSDIWIPFFHCFRRFWPSCQYPVYLVTNHLDPAFKGVQTIQVGTDVSWSDNVIKALSTVQEDYVLMFIDDLLLHGPVDTAKLQQIVAWVDQERPPHVQLVPSEPPDALHNPLVGRVLPGSLYRTSTVMTLWKKEALLALLRPGESAWAFELAGSARSDALGDFFRSWHECFPVTNCIIKGKWLPSSLATIRHLGVPLDLSRRRVMTRRQHLGYLGIVLRAKVFRLFPRKWRRKVRLWLLR
jgi:hypothetical protein